jgi:hypothetical protein
VGGFSIFRKCIMNRGILKARKYRDRQSVIACINSLPLESVIITSSCKGVCTWAREAAEKRGMEVMVFTPDLTNIRAFFEVPKRYYERNKELIESCDLLHAFLSQEDGFTGGTQFEIEYAVRLGIPIQIHWENGGSHTIYQYSFPFIEGKQELFLAWEAFFHTTNLKIRGE